MRGGGVWSWAESLNNSEIGSTSTTAFSFETYDLSGYTSSLFFLASFYPSSAKDVRDDTTCNYVSTYAALIDSETVVPKASSTSSSCHCPPSKHIVAPLPSFLKKKALHVLWYQKVDHSSWAVNRTLLPLGVILIVFFSFRTKAIVPQLPQPIGTSTYHASGTTVFENHPKSHI